MKDQANKNWLKNTDEHEKHWHEKQPCPKKIQNIIFYALLIIMAAILLFAPKHAKSDGLDDPNFYREFDSNPCKYSYVIEPSKPCYQLVQTGQSQEHHHLDNTQPNNNKHQPIPEPQIILMLGIGLTIGWVASKKTL
jgi:hypothetical protein